MKPSTIALLLFALAVHPVKAQYQSPKVMVSFNSLTQYGRNNRDSVERALGRLDVPFDTLDRSEAGSDTIDYTPYNSLIWSSGDPAINLVPGEPSGQSGLSEKEIAEVERFLNAGESDCKKSFVIAGQNIAYEHGFLMPHGASIDTEFLQSHLHTKFVARSPDSVVDRRRINGDQPAYWTYNDYILSSSPNVVRPALTTPQVGPIVNELAYSYGLHPLTPSDSGAGISFYNNVVNLVFYAFDWADPVQTAPNDSSENVLTSGTTRVLAAAFAFITSHYQPPYCTESVESVNGDKTLFEITAIAPNPTQGNTNVTFTLPSQSLVTIRIIDLLGRTRKTPFDELPMPPGTWSKTLDLGGIPAGIYTCEIVAASESSGTIECTENFIVQ